MPDRNQINSPSDLDITKHIVRFDASNVLGIALMGSHARGDAGPYSDIDLVRLVADHASDIPGSGSHLIKGKLVVVSDIRRSEVDRWFTMPEVAVNTLGGLQRAAIQLDRDNSLTELQERARAFEWDDVMQQRANRWASRQLIDLIEEVHKGLEGLRRNHTGRLLNARFGLSWLLSRVVQVQRGILLSGDNAFIEEVEETLGPDTLWCQLRRIVFCIMEPGQPVPTLHEQVHAGLELYAATVTLLSGTLRQGDSELIHETVQRIHRALPRNAGRHIWR